MQYLINCHEIYFLKLNQENRQQSAKTLREFCTAKYLLTGEYKTEVREIDQDEKPIVGQNKSLSCYNSEENKGNPEAEQNSVRWVHDGHTVQNDDRHEGASTRVR